MRPRRIGAAAASLGLVAGSLAAQTSPVPSCPGPLAPVAGDARGPDPADGGGPGREGAELGCFELHPTARGGDAAGVVELRHVPSPFGVTVTPEGHHLRELVVHVEGLPDPASLGAFTTHVAWATPVTLDSLIRLGPVADGATRLGTVALNKYLLLISAEASGEGESRDGPLVLRGRSPSSLMEAHDLLALAPSATQRSGREGPRSWAHPPMYPEIPMLPGVMDLEPRTGALSLGEGAVPPLEELPPAVGRQLVALPDGGTLDLEAEIVRREIAGRSMRMLAFNRQHPGPLIRVGQGSTIFVNFTNRTPFPTSVHWHGVRLDNRFDGVPGVTQDPVHPGETFRYQIHFRDAGIYWYHPHHREDVQQELGLYGNMLVDSPRPDYYGPANRDEVLMLDDLLLDDAGLVPFGRESANYMLMGRFGNVFLVNGEPDYRLEVDRGEVVRFHLTNVSNTRTFNLSWAPAADLPEDWDGRSARLPPPAPLRRLPVKVVASDVGRFEREERARSVVLAPAERYVVEVRFEEAGEVRLLNHVQGINHRQGVFRPELAVLGTVAVSTRVATPDHAHAFETMREHPEVIADVGRYREHFDRPVDHELVLTLETADLPLPIERSMAYDWVYFNPVEWTGTMPVMNWATTGREIRWILREPSTGRENEEIDWRFEVGDVVKIRLVNDRSAFHAMQHPLHFHGQRFLVLEVDGVPNENLVWKDTALLPVGSTTDILLELSNPGRWMIHCHIAEHLESGMKTVMEVVP